MIDVRQIYFVEGGASANALVRHILDGFREFIGRRDRLWASLKDVLRGIDWVRVGPSGVEVKLSKKSRVDLAELLRAVDEWCERNFTRFMIILDKGQYMRFSNIRYDGALA